MAQKLANLHEEQITLMKNQASGERSLEDEFSF
jgi:hypothetical protein